LGQLETPAPSLLGRLPFGVVLGAVAVLGAGIRFAYVVFVAPHGPLYADSFFYYEQALNLRHGLGYIEVFREFGHVRHPQAAGNFPTAYWPPGYPAFLVVIQSAFGDAIRTSKLGGCLSGAATIALTGVLGRDIAGRRIGLLGALLVALSPFVIAVDGSLMSEVLYVPLVLLALVIAQRTRRSPTAPGWCALGVVIALAALTRQDALFLVPLVVLPTAILAHDPVRHLLPRVALGLAAMTLVLTPWVVRNDRDVGVPAISTISGFGTLAGANCDDSYNGSRLGYQAVHCMHLALEWKVSEANWYDRLQHDTFDYAFSHVSRWPVVGAARVLRVWGLWNPDQQTRFEARQNRNVNWQRLAWLVSTATLGVGLIGFRILARQRRQIAMLIAPVAMATIVALVTLGNTRYGATAEPVLAIGAAVSLLRLRERLRGDDGVRFPDIVD
jgi:hypothetical protein